MIDFDVDEPVGLEVEYFGACRARGHRGQATNGLMDAPCNECEAEMEEAE